MDAADAPAPVDDGQCRCMPVATSPIARTARAPRSRPSHPCHHPSHHRRLFALVLCLAAAFVSGSAGPATGSPPFPVTGWPGSSTLPEQRGPEVFVPEWSWPLEPVPTVLRTFEKPPRTWQRGHRGVDLSTGAEESAAILSPADGVVFFAGTVVNRGVLSIDHGGGRISSFEPVETALLKGQRVAAGDVVGALATATGEARGHCGFPCLHWGVRADGEYVDPLSFVMDRRPSVLLPLAG